MQVGLIGLGRMGQPMGRRLVQAGYRVIGYDLLPEARNSAQSAGLETVTDLESLVGSLDATRVIWMMLPAGDPTQAVIDELSALLLPGDLVVDGGNSDWRDAALRGRSLGATGVHFIDAGVSGGQWGWIDGYGIAVGGPGDDYAHIEPVLRALTADGAHAHVGELGAGHFTKAVHNAVEYGVMQAYAEGYALLRAHAEVDTVETMRVWQQGCVVRSFLLDQIVKALEKNPHLKDIGSRVADSGMGRWTGEEALRLAVATPVLTAALHARFVSQDLARDSARLLVAARAQIGGHSSHA
jgi:6-phosphogluconate dehydrogenase